MNSTTVEAGMDLEPWSDDVIARSPRLGGDFVQRRNCSPIFRNIVGHSPEIQRVLASIRRIGPYFRTVLITGESGTGKELVARALRELNPVGAGPFAVLNCASLPEPLVDSELFGYVKGAFTGALTDRPGLFESAHNGIVFLDEIGELPPAAQAKLLRVLQDGEVRPVGSVRGRRIDFRLIAATNRDLKALVKAKEFRADLYYRIAPFHIQLPPLRERVEDIACLAHHILKNVERECGKPIRHVTALALEVLQSYAWPGNIRELENALTHAVVMSVSGDIDICDLPEYLRSQPYGPRPNSSSTERPGWPPTASLQRVIESHVRCVLAGTNGRRAEAAERLGIGRTTLYRILRRDVGGAKNTRRVSPSASNSCPNVGHFADSRPA